MDEIICLAAGKTLCPIAHSDSLMDSGHHFFSSVCCNKETFNKECIFDRSMNTERGDDARYGRRREQTNDLDFSFSFFFSSQSCELWWICVIPQNFEFEILLSLHFQGSKHHMQLTFCLYVCLIAWALVRSFSENLKIYLLYMKSNFI